MTYSDEYGTQRTGFRLVFLSFINRIFLWLLTRFSSKAGTSPLWRLCSRFLFLEMQIRQWRGPLSAKPYVHFERYFAHSPEHLQRFQNFIAGGGILIDLLAVNWFEYLPIKDRVLVTSLFRRIYKTENVWLSYRNRPAIIDRTSTLKNLDQDDLPKSVFIVPVRYLSGRMGAWLTISKFFVSIGSAIEVTTRAIHRSISSLFSNIIILLLALPLFLFSILGFSSPRLKAWVTRNKIRQLSEFSPQSKKMGELLSRYETQHAGNPDQAGKIADLLKKPNFKPLLTKRGIDGLTFKDRVLVTSLLRRCAAQDNEFANLLSAANMDGVIAVKSQRHIPQLTQPGTQQISEWKIFKKLNSGQEHKAAPSKTPSAKSSVSMPRKRTGATSEAILQQQGWFNSTQTKDMEFATLLRNRAYNEAIKFADKPESFDALSPQLKTKAAAFMALLERPFTHNLAKAEIDNTLLMPAVIRNRKERNQANKALSAAPHHLYPDYEGHLAHSPLACWKALKDAFAVEDETEFSYAAEKLTASYSHVAYNRITERSVSFDTFLITHLEEILDKIRIWVDWENSPKSALVAYAHAAALVGNRACFDFFIATLDDKTGIPPNFIVSLYDIFFKSGLHKLDAILSPDIAALEDSQLRSIDAKKKYLCLVELGASIQPLHKIEGVTNKLLCGPVAPTDAIKFPPEATLVQVEDFIPMYSTEDMEIGQEADRITEHYLNHTRSALASAGLPERYMDAVEVTHATVFIALYRDAISARICEKLIESASDYDGIILLTKTGRILGNMIAPAIEAVGRENVFLSLGSHRSPEFYSALATMRSAAKTGTLTPASKDVENSGEWISIMRGWTSATMNFHSKAMQSVKPGPYSIMALEQINGYFDSYQALINEGLAHSNVEVFTSAANARLNDAIIDGGFKPYEKAHEVRRSVMRVRTPDARPWTIPFVQTLRGSLDGFDSPYLPKYHDMFLERAQGILAQRLPQVMDAMSYFHARFAEGLPDYVFTAPNQHIISRAAAYCAKTAAVPVYDFLILANTNHPRYRPLIADYAYLYDPWYKEIYQSFFGMEEDQLRTSGPLFEYSERLKQAPNEDYAAPHGKTHIVFFSQSANFDNSKIMLESICQAVKERTDIYITVKLHPHESPANVERYTQIAADNDVKDNLHVFHKGDAVALLNQADLVVQSFSNVGLDALLLKKPVITFKPKTDLKARIFLYEKDIGYVVSTKHTLTNKIKKFLKDPKDRAAMQEIADKFAKENDHFLRGNNAARMMKTVQKDVKRFKTNREI